MLLGVVVIAAAAVAIAFIVTNSEDDPGETAASSITSEAAADGSSSQPSSTSATTAESAPTKDPGPVTTTTVPGPVTVSAASWQTVTDGLGGDGGQSLYDIAAIGDGYVAVGISDTNQVWTSPDAVSWTAQKAPGLEAARLLHVESAPDGTLVGVGHDLTDTQAFAAWTSSDGITWIKQPPSSGTLPAGIQSVADFAAHPDGYVAVGLVVVDDGEFDAAWWTSPDGSNWTAGTIAEPGVQQVLGVAVSNGVIVAAGENRPDTGIWIAETNGTFQRVDDTNLTTAVSDFDPTNDAARVFAWDVAAGESGFIAVGADQTTAGTSIGAVWTSNDGQRWRRFGNETDYQPNMLHANFAGNTPWTVMDEVVQTQGTSIVVGRTGPPGDPDLAIWESEDGITWRQGAVGIIPGIQLPSTAVVLDGKLIVVGTTGAITHTPEADGAIWVATPIPDAPTIGALREVAQLATGFGGIFGAHTNNNRAISFGLEDTITELRVWESPDGTNWSRLTLQAAPTQVAQLNGISAIDGEFLLTGQDPSPAIWRSSDLSTWQQAVTPASANGFITGVQQVAGQLIAYGGIPSSGVVVWRSPDGRTWTDTPASQNIGAGFGVGVVDFNGNGVLGVGDLYSPGLAIWTSVDGQTWTRIADDPKFADFWPTAIAEFEGQLVVGGTVPQGGEPSPAILTSTDLDSWDLLVLSGSTLAPVEGGVTGISVLDSQLVVTGYTGPSANGDPGMWTAVSADSRPALWATADLTFWTRSDPLPTAGVANDQIATPAAISAAVRIGDNLVAVGYSDRGDGVWRATAWTGDKR